MDSILEQHRSCHEERERIENAMVRELMTKRNTVSCPRMNDAGLFTVKQSFIIQHREHINSDHRIKFLLDVSVRMFFISECILFSPHQKYIEVTNKVKELYEDKDGARKAEIAAISASNEFNEFYRRFKGLKDLYKNKPNNEAVVPLSTEYEQYISPAAVLNSQSAAGLSSIVPPASGQPAEPETISLVDFTDEEGYGKFLDLYEQFNLYINLKNIVGPNQGKVDYLSYLNNFDHFYEISKEKKFFADYQNYLASLHDYLEEYVIKVKPLLPLKEIISKLSDDFERMWENGQVPGWPKETGSVLSNVGAPLDLSAFNSVDELASLGLDRLKSALIAQGLKCGG